MNTSNQSIVKTKAIVEQLKIAMLTLNLSMKITDSQRVDIINELLGEYIECSELCLIFNELNELQNL